MRRHGGHPVHLLPAGGRHRVRAGRRRADLRPGAAGDVHPGRRERLRPRLGRLRHHLRRRLPAERAARARPTTSSTPTPSSCSATSPTPRPSARRCWRCRSRWCCRPTTSASRPATASTCWTRAASSASPSAPPTSAGCARWPRAAAKPGWRARPCRLSDEAAPSPCPPLLRRAPASPERQDRRRGCSSARGRGS